jgi:hypothetical protein
MTVNAGEGSTEQPPAQGSGGLAWTRLDAFALASLLIVQAALTAWTWQTSPDVLVDFGSHVYVPWRLAEGELL